MDACEVAQSQHQSTDLKLRCACSFLFFAYGRHQIMCEGAAAAAAARVLKVPLPGHTTTSCAHALRTLRPTKEFRPSQMSLVAATIAGRHADGVEHREPPRGDTYSPLRTPASSHVPLPYRCDPSLHTPHVNSPVCNLRICAPSLPCSFVTATYDQHLYVYE